MQRGLKLINHFIGLYRGQELQETMPADTQVDGWVVVRGDTTFSLTDHHPWITRVAEICDQRTPSTRTLWDVRCPEQTCKSSALRTALGEDIDDYWEERDG